jgi:uncharacterized protein involved in exopolysaccharide biosynthesis
MVVKMTEVEYKYESEDEFELMDLFNAISKRKWLIIIPTLFLIFIAGIYSFLKTPVWNVESLIQPAKFIIQTTGWQFEEVLVLPPEQIAGQINEKSYNHLLVAELNLDIQKFPEIKAGTLDNTSLIRVITKETNVSKAKSIQLALFKHIKSELDKKVDVEMKNIESQIKSQEINKSKIKEEIKVLGNKLSIIDKRKNEIEKALVETRERVELLENEQKANLNKQNWTTGEALGMLLYSNEIQQSLRYLNNLNESLSQKKLEEEDIKNRIEDQQKNIEQIENRIENLRQQKTRIDYTLLIKEPTSSVDPVAPKKIFNIVIAGFLGIFIFTFVVFFIEYIQNQKTTNTKTNRIKNE